MFYATEEPMARIDEPGICQIDVSGSEFEGAAPTSQDDVGKKRLQKSPLTVLLES